MCSRCFTPIGTEMPFSADELHSIPLVISAPRFATYLSECYGDKKAALELYEWNLSLSCALFLPLHMLEVSIRNAICEAIELSYGANWPWTTSFEISLPSPHPPNFNPRRTLVNTRNNHATVGKVIADMKFAFWQNMFTGRHDGPIWNHHLKTVLPNSPNNKTVQVRRRELYDALNVIRVLRNRIAHHEPIFRRNIISELDLIIKVVRWRDVKTAEWLIRVENVSAHLNHGPYLP